MNSSPVVDAFRDDPDIQRVFQNDKFQGCQVPPTSEIIAVRGIIKALEIVTFVLLQKHAREERPA